MSDTELEMYTEFIMKKMQEIKNQLEKRQNSERKKMLLKQGAALFKTQRGKGDEESLEDNEDDQEKPKKGK